MGESTQAPGVRPVERPIAPEPVHRGPEPAGPDLAQMLAGMPPPSNSAEQQEIDALQNFLKQQNGAKLQEAHTSMPKDVQRTGQQDKGLLKTLKSLFHYLTFNAFKKK